MNPHPLITAAFAFLISASAVAAPHYPIRDKLFATIQEIRPSPELSLVKKFLDETPKIDPSLPAEKKAEALSGYIFRRWKIAPDKSYESREQRDNVLPDSVLKTRRGHCLGLTALYLLAAEKAGVQAFLVRAPDHVFPRICSKQSCVNVETLKQGEIVRDGYYIENLTIPKLAVEKKIYLQSLDSPDQLMGSVYLGLGYIAGKAGQLDVAEFLYKKAVTSAPDFADPYSNLAAVYWDLGKEESALKLLHEAIEKNPTHYATLINLGALAQKKGQSSEALKFYNRALDSNPLSAQGYWARSRILRSLQRDSDALLDIEKVLLIRPKFCDAISGKAELFEKLGKPGAEGLKKGLESLNRSGSCGGI